MCPRRELVNIKGMSDAKVDKMIEVAGKIESSGFISGYEVSERRKRVKRISTGSSSLNNLLCGGIESMSITEAFGEFRTGKTQLGHTLAVTSQMSLSEGGGAGKVIYIDTEGTFRPERIVKIAERFNMDPAKTLENILYSRALTVDNLISLLIQAGACMMEDTYSLLIIDSIMAPFRVDYSGRGELSERQQTLGKLLSKLLKISEQFNIAVYMTNQVTADPGATMAYGDTKKPVGGNIIAHASTTRLYFKKGKGEQRICRIYDSPLIAETEVPFQLSEGGIIDANE